MIYFMEVHTGEPVAKQLEIANEDGTTTLALTSGGIDNLSTMGHVRAELPMHMGEFISIVIGDKIHTVRLTKLLYEKLCETVFEEV